MNYLQCQLLKGATAIITWLPKKFAILKKSVILKDEYGWNGEWTVTHVGSIELDEETVIKNSNDYRKTRKASDI